MAARRDWQLVCDGEPMVVQLSPTKWCCLLCRAQSRSYEEQEAHLSSLDHQRRVADAKLSGRIRQPGLKLEAERACSAISSWLKASAARVCSPAYRAFAVLAVDLYLWLFADRWHSQVPPPTRIDETKGPDSSWGLVACGVEVRACKDMAKGKGAFATRVLLKGSTVGVYLGEPLTQRQYELRHFCGDTLDAAEETHLQRRSERLEAIVEGAPMGGVNNHGAYVFQLFPSQARSRGARTTFLDAEDPNLSSWCRYINCAPAASAECNLKCRMSAHRALVWFEASRDIAVGEELHFDYDNGGAHWLHRYLSG